MQQVFIQQITYLVEYLVCAMHWEHTSEQDNNLPSTMGFIF